MSSRSDFRRNGRPRNGLLPLPAGIRDDKTPALLTGAPPPSRDRPASPPKATSNETSARSRMEELEARLAECTADLQRVKAEYDNYRKRVRRDRLAVGEAAVANVLRGLLPVLDAVARARELGAVHGGFQQVAQTLETELAALGLEAFGEAGEPFDPARYEALSHARSTEVDRATCSKVLAPGYRVGDQLLRPAQVMVTEPPAPTGDR
ncbi:MAG TPA: nucleotide exchange factor GrpE [Actinomadura sp.]|nr:nucleotide exchange factor GrpE [Actinomadura sp.]